MRTQRDIQRGFTLLEVIVAVMLLLIAMAGFLPFFLQGLDQSSSTRYRSTATNLARERMEQVRQLDYREITDAAGLAARFGITAEVRNATFSVSYAVETVPYDTGEMKKVTVTVDWTPPPYSSPAVISTMIHQQYLGPRGSLLEVEPTLNDPLGTPFDRLTDGTTTATYHIAHADWGLIFDDPNDSSQAPRDVYMRLTFVDDAGASIPVGDPDNDWVIDSSHVQREWDAGGTVSDVYFEYDFDPTVVPDGYWEMRACAYNEFDEPGNTWRLRVRREQLPPDMPGGFVATPQDDAERIVLTWSPGAERDRDHYVLERRKLDIDGVWSAWSTISDALPPDIYMYTDIGSMALETDPWGSYDPYTANFYEYRVWAVDWSTSHHAGEPAYAQTQLPPLMSTTTLVPTTTSTTVGVSSTTTTLLYEVIISNSSNKEYSVSVRDSGSTQVHSGTVARNGSMTVSGLPPGAYHILASSPGRTDIAHDFSLPGQAGQIVLTILP